MGTTYTAEGTIHTSVGIIHTKGGTIHTVVGTKHTVVGTKYTAETIVHKEEDTMLIMESVDSISRDEPDYP